MLQSTKEKGIGKMSRDIHCTHVVNLFVKTLVRDLCHPLYLCLLVSVVVVKIFQFSYEIAFNI